MMRISCLAFVLVFLSATPLLAESDTCESKRIQKAVELINQERKKRNLESVRCTPKLLEAALVHSKDMCERDFFSHTDPDGDRFVHRMRKIGIVSHAGGENIARGQTSSEEVVREWMASEGHRDNILDKEFRRMGIGYVNCQDQHYWTQTFAGSSPKSKEKSKNLARGMKKQAKSKSEDMKKKTDGTSKPAQAKKQKQKESEDPEKVAAKTSTSEKNKKQQKAKAGKTEKTPTGDEDSKKEAEISEQKETTTRLGEPQKRNWDAIAEDLEKSFEGFMEKAPE